MKTPTKEPIVIFVIWFSFFNIPNTSLITIIFPNLHHAVFRTLNCIYMEIYGEDIICNFRCHLLPLLYLLPKCFQGFHILTFGRLQVHQLPKQIRAVAHYKGCL